MEISVTKLQPPWRGWPLRNVRIKRMVSDQLMGQVGSSLLAPVSIVTALPSLQSRYPLNMVVIVDCATLIGTAPPEVSAASVVLRPICVVS